MTFVPEPPPPATGGGPLPPATRDPVAILLLNLFFCGAGSLLIGQKQKGIVAIVVGIVVAFLTCGSGLAILNVITAVDGYLQAQTVREGHAIGQWTWFKQRSA